MIHTMLAIALICCALLLAATLGCADAKRQARPAAHQSAQAQKWAPLMDDGCRMVACDRIAMRTTDYNLIGKKAP